MVGLRHEETLAVMKIISLSGAILAATATGAAAEPKRLMDSELAGVRAGLFDVVFIVPVTIVNNTSESAAVGIHAEGVASKAESTVTVNNAIMVSQATQLGNLTLPDLGAFAGAGWPVAASGTSTAGTGLSLLQAWTMVADMLRTRSLGRGW
jgi:hypothetical protein